MKSILGFFLTIALVLFGGLTYWSARDMPNIQATLASGIQPSQYTQVLDRHGEPIFSFGRFHHENTTLSDISPRFLDALIATEDRRFYQHFGVDPIAIVRAVTVDILKKRMAEGGSTLTQQLTRTLFLSNERSMKRKIQEALLSIQLEQKLKKPEILRLYVNHTYFGEGAYGIAAASQVYFHKKPADLTWAEAALLAGLPQAPSAYNPYVNPKKAMARRNEVLQNLVETGKLSREEAAVMADTPLGLNAASRDSNSSNQAPYFNQWILQQVQELYGYDEQSFWQSGLQIHTTLSLKAQRAASEALKQQMRLAGRTRDNEQGSVLSLDTKTGGILAYVGGVNYRTSQFDRVRNAKRQPGSLFKVFTYTTAMESGFLPERVYFDEPIAAGTWEPKNYDGKFHGYMTMARAFATSNNIVAVKVMHEVTPQRVVEMAQRMGLTGNLPPDLSLTLGASEVTMLELTAAINVIANQGNRVEPYAIEHIVDRTGQRIYEHHALETPVLDPETTHTMISLMQGVVQLGTGQASNIGRPVAGKTGTTDAHRDGWFVGFTPDVITAVWVGNDDNTPVPHLTGGGLPARVWAQTMRASLAGRPAKVFQTEHTHLKDPAIYTTVDLKHLSESETNHPLAKTAGRALPQDPTSLDDPLLPEDGGLEGDPTLDNTAAGQGDDPAVDVGDPDAPVSNDVMMPSPAQVPMPTHRPRIPAMSPSAGAATEGRARRAPVSAPSPEETLPPLRGPVPN